MIEILKAQNMTDKWSHLFNEKLKGCLSNPQTKVGIEEYAVSFPDRKSDEYIESSRLLHILPLAIMCKMEDEEDAVQLFLRHINDLADKEAFFHTLAPLTRIEAYYESQDWMGIHKPLPDFEIPKPDAYIYVFYPAVDVAVKNLLKDKPFVCAEGTTPFKFRRAKKYV